MPINSEYFGENFLKSVCLEKWGGICILLHKNDWVSKTIILFLSDLPDYRHEITWTLSFHVILYRQKAMRTPTRSLTWSALNPIWLLPRIKRQNCLPQTKHVKGLNSLNRSPISRLHNCSVTQVNENSPFMHVSPSNPVPEQSQVKLPGVFVQTPPLSHGVDGHSSMSKTDWEFQLKTKIRKTTALESNSTQQAHDVALPWYWSRCAVTTSYQRHYNVDIMCP